MSNLESISLTEVHKFLLGEGPLDGVWYGDVDTDKPRKRLWWREFLRAAIMNQVNGN